MTKPEIRYAIVTGSGSGLGRALCLELARERWHIAVVDINRAGAEETVSLLQKAGITAQAHQVDVTDLAQWEALSKELRSQWPRLDLLVNNAGVAGAGPVGEYPISDWQWVMDVNLWSVIYGCHVFVDWLKANPNGAHIINTASMAGIACAPGMAPYNVSKAGVIALSETLWSELRSLRIGITVVCPEFFRTALLDQCRITDPLGAKFARKAFEKSTFTAEDVARETLRAMKGKRLYVLMPRAARMRWRIKRLNPQYFLGMVASLFEKARAAAEEREAKSTQGNAHAT